MFWLQWNKDPSHAFKNFHSLGFELHPCAFIHYQWCLLLVIKQLLKNSSAGSSSLSRFDFYVSCHAGSKNMKAEFLFHLHHLSQNISHFSTLPWLCPRYHSTAERVRPRSPKNALHVPHKRPYDNYLSANSLFLHNHVPACCGSLLKGLCHWLFSESAGLCWSAVGHWSAHIYLLSHLPSGSEVPALLPHRRKFLVRLTEDEKLLLRY